MSAPKIALMLCLALAAYALAFTPDVQAGASSSCAGLPAGCGVPDLAFDVGCAEPAAASCGGRERSILLVRGDGRWIPGERIFRGVRGILTPFDGIWRMSPQPRRYGRHRGHGCD